MTNGLFFGSITVLVGTIESLLSFVILPFCEPADGVFMRCHYTSIVDGFVGIAIAITGIAYLFLASRNFESENFTNEIYNA